ncbi:MAG TPA: SDR family oxidoreductase [Trueperaceae bacterium]
MARKLEGKIAVVTGADSGIGQATAVEFAKEGADVVVDYLQDEEGAAATKRSVEAQGGRALVVPADVRDESEVARLFRETREALGVPDILVNNAGISSPGTRVADMSTQAWDDVLRTDLYGPFFCCREFLRLRQGTGGRIINITSVHQQIPSVGGAPYDAAKGGLESFTRTLALELAAEGINVNSIAPGMVLTPMNARAKEDPGVRERQASHIPVKRAAQPWEVGRLAVYLASEDAGFVTGQSFVIDGGQMLACGQGA